MAGSRSSGRGAVPGTEPTEPGPEYVDEHHEAIARFAADYLDEDERDRFVNHLMERRGYRRIESWGPPEDTGDGQDLGDGQGDDYDDGQDDGGRAAGRGGAGRQPATTGTRRRPQYFKR